MSALRAARLSSLALLPPLLLGACAGGADDDAGDAGTSLPDPFPDCRAVTTGGLIDDDPSDGARLLAAAMAEGPLPTTLDVAALAPFDAELVAYLADVPAAAPGAALIVEDDGPLASVARAAFAGAGGYDPELVAAGLLRYFACDRELPRSLDAFLVDIYPFVDDAPDQELAESEVKGLRRRIWRSAARGAFVAQTVRTDGSVRETEAILTDRRADGRLDFLEYDEAGALRAASVFRQDGVERAGPTPAACIGCHTFTGVSPP